MEQGLDPVVKRFRERISEQDRHILQAVNRRIELVAELHAYKVASGYPLGDPGREAELLEELERLNPGPLTNEGLRELYAAVLSEWRRRPAAAGAAAQ